MEEGGKSWPRPPKMKGKEGGSKEEEEMTKFVHNIFPTLRGAVGQHSGGRGGSNNRLETSPRTSTLSFLLPPLSYTREKFRPPPHFSPFAYLRRLGRIKGNEQ